jgi:hypothetical protein
MRTLVFGCHCHDERRVRLKVQLELSDSAFLVIVDGDIKECFSGVRKKILEAFNLLESLRVNNLSFSISVSL